MINVADIVNEETGLTFREENNNKKHNIPIGSLVEVKYEEWYGDGACAIIHARLFVVDHDRDYDGTPLYTLAKSKTQQEYYKVEIEGYVPAYFPISNSGFPEYMLTIIEMTQDVIDGVGALSWDE
ncbi:MAG: hypothetical protein PHC28_05840 [Flavobacterium sp.]|uniref:hypothetical protein n=1 Tax=Flavobacterium sp. TaxID=239 RepID=UPI00260E9D59|nr:hypothetical protein [Flavobacterium sp.]MDD5149990.1 hypothetical protein [Flavobacterium sp.]